MLTLPILLILLLVLPLATSLFLLAMGRRVGEPLAGYVGTGTSMASFGISIAMLVTWIYKGATWGYESGPYLDFVRWLPVGNYAGQRDAGFLQLVVYLDSLGILMMTMVSLVSAVVHLFSLGYIKGDRRYPQFFSYLSLFSFCMMGLILSGSLLQMLVFFELVGLCSYLLIGFWQEKRDASRAAIKAFVVNRVGDVGFIIGVGILIAYFGTATLPDLWLILGHDSDQTSMSAGLLTIVGMLLAMGAFGKSAQFPLHTWLPDAMAGPTPVSALIHAATMVAAGVFLLARIYPILTPDARLFVLIIGGVTILLGSLCALAQRDLKKALAFSTIAQLGYMVLAIGVGSWSGAIFHLITHAFFKALLFLGAGNVIYTMHHDGQLAHYGGLWRRMPVTAVTFAIGMLAMSGAPFLSGFYSKELIIAHAASYTELASQEHRAVLLQLALWVPVIAAYLTPLYMTRLWMLTFAGRPRKRKLYRDAGEAGVMSFPLVLLSGMAIVTGYSWFPVQSMIQGTIIETNGYFRAMPQLSSDRADPLAISWPMLMPSPEGISDSGEPTEVTVAPLAPVEQRVTRGYDVAHKLTGWAWLIGILTGIAIWWRGFALTDRMARFTPFAFVRHALAHRLYFDDLYDLVFVGAVQVVCAVAVGVDRYLIDPAINATARLARSIGHISSRADDAAVDGVVRGVSEAIWQGGGAMRLTQSGRIRIYVASAVALGILIVAGVVVVGIAR
jgi:proton-translocating NADH-quinone oxidoreductase chain L